MYEFYDTYDGEELIGTTDSLAIAFDICYERIEATDGECAITYKAVDEPNPSYEEALDQIIETASERYFNKCEIGYFDVNDDDYIDRADYSDEFYD